MCWAFACMTDISAIISHSRPTCKVPTSRTLPVLYSQLQIVFCLIGWKTLSNTTMQGRLPIVCLTDWFSGWCWLPHSRTSACTTPFSGQFCMCNTILGSVLPVQHRSRVSFSCTTPFSGQFCLYNTVLGSVLPVQHHSRVSFASSCYTMCVKFTLRAWDVYSVHGICVPWTVCISYMDVSLVYRYTEQYGWMDGCMDGWMNGSLPKLASWSLSFTIKHCTRRSSLHTVSDEASDASMGRVVVGV